MTNNWLNDLKFKLFKSGNPILLYIGINAIIFVVVSLFSVFLFMAGSRGLIDGFIRAYLAFPSLQEMWLTRFYTILTYQFFHADFFHILFNMLWLYWMGRIFLDFVKPRQFHFVYLVGGIVGAVFYAIVYNLLPVFNNNVGTLIGASAAVASVFAAAATLVPDYSIRLLFVGEVKLKYLLLVYILLNFIGVESANAGGSVAHLGGVLFGFIYIKLLQNGTDLSKIFERKPKLKVVKNEAPQKRSSSNVNQKEVDAILDKISKSGYDKLTKEEKDTLFKASNS
ncbi:MAG: rhomboid family intramembrane serine protease [Flavobacterium sp.]|nr:MAG: rhomboid family intramembrane serine protease [Flavobacterium sp.]